MKVKIIKMNIPYEDFKPDWNNEYVILIRNILDDKHLGKGLVEIIDKYTSQTISYHSKKGCDEIIKRVIDDNVKSLEEYKNMSVCTVNYLVVRIFKPELIHNYYSELEYN